MATMMTSTIAPDAVVNHRKRLSAPNRRCSGRAPPPPNAGPGGPRGAPGPAETGRSVSAEPVTEGWLIGSGEVAHGGRDLRPDRVRQRGVAPLGRGRLAVRADGV